MAKPIAIHLHYGYSIEYQGVTISLQHNEYHIFNIYRPRDSAKLKIDHIFAIANDSPSILCGDFNAHNPLWNNPTNASTAKTCTTGHYLQNLLQEFSNVSLLNSKDTIHLCGGVLDLTFVTSSLLPSTKWSLHPFLASDHFAVTTTIQAFRVPAPPPNPKWILWKGNWHLYKDLMETWADGFIPPEDIDHFEFALVSAIQQAVTQAFPPMSPSSPTHKNQWFYNDRTREVRHGLIMRKTLKRHPSPELLAIFRATNKHICKKIQAVKPRTWLEWSETLNVHTSLKNLWRKLNAISGKFKKQPHPQRKREADALITMFKTRSDTTQLPLSTQCCLRIQDPMQDASISYAINKPADSDQPFSHQELRKALKTGTDTAPGLDRITFHAQPSRPSSTWHSPFAIYFLPSPKLETCRHTTHSKIQPSWFLQAHFFTIMYRKTMERTVLARLLFYIPHPHQHIYAYTKDLSTKDNLATIYSLTDGVDSITFHDIEKAFELANCKHPCCQRCVWQIT